LTTKSVTVRVGRSHVWAKSILPGQPWVELIIERKGRDPQFLKIHGPEAEALQLGDRVNVNIENLK
jgi:hypothetical protein